MKVKVIIAALLLAGAGMSANAQSTDDNWFLQGQLGASYSLDGTGIGKLISPAGQIAAGKYFNPYVGARLAVSGWRGRAGSGSRPAEGFYYGAATVDGLFNMSSLFCGSNPERFFNARLIAGVGYNRTVDEGASSFMARLGLQASFRLNKAFDFNVEALANGVSDRWNHRDDHSFDSYYNVLVGMTKSTSCRVPSTTTSVPNRFRVPRGKRACRASKATFPSGWQRRTSPRTSRSTSWPLRTI